MDNIFESNPIHTRFSPVIESRFETNSESSAVSATSLASDVVVASFSDLEPDLESESDSESLVKDNENVDVSESCCLSSSYIFGQEKDWEVVWRLDLGSFGKYGAMYVWTNIGHKKALEYCMMHPTNHVLFYTNEKEEPVAWAAVKRLTLAGDWRELLDADSDDERCKHKETSYWRFEDVPEVPKSISEFYIKDDKPRFIDVL